VLEFYSCKKKNWKQRYSAEICLSEDQCLREGHLLQGTEDPLLQEEKENVIDLALLDIPEDTVVHHQDTEEDPLCRDEETMEVNVICVHPLPYLLETCLIIFVNEMLLNTSKDVADFTM